VRRLAGARLRSGHGAPWPDDARGVHPSGTSGDAAGVGPRAGSPTVSGGRGGVPSRNRAPRRRLQGRRSRRRFHAGGEDAPLDEP
jgi:hypothetical protein